MATANIDPALERNRAFAAASGQLAENLLPGGALFEVTVIHHTQGGTAALTHDAFRHRYAERIGADESTLRERAVLDPTAIDGSGLR